MRWFIAGLSVLVILMPWRVALAQSVSAEVLLEALVDRTPGAVLDQMRGNPERFLEEAAGLVLGYGGSRGIDAAGIEDAIGTERARVRARELKRLLGADLNDDLAVSASELEVALAAASATMRGRLLMWHRAADADGDGTVGWNELRGHAQALADAALSPAAADAMRSMMIFDLDGDGRVRMSEVLEAVELLKAPA